MLVTLKVVANPWQKITRWYREPAILKRKLPYCIPWCISWHVKPRPLIATSVGFRKFPCSFWLFFIFLKWDQNNTIISVCTGAFDWPYSRERQHTVTTKITHKRFLNLSEYKMDSEYHVPRRPANTCSFIYLKLHIWRTSMLIPIPKCGQSNTT